MSHILRRALPFTVAGALLAGALPARAEDAPAPAEGAKAPQVKATAITLPHPGVTDEVMVAVTRTIEAGLKKNPRLEVKDLDTRLADFAQEVPQDQLDGARQALKDGQQALLELNIAVALQKLNDAVNGLAKVLPYIKKQELADAMASLAVAHLENGDKATAKKEFVRLLVWRQDYEYDVAKLPPKYLTSFEEAKKEVERMKKGSLKISSSPEGAQAYIDGKYIGVTPCSATDLLVGEHYVTLKKEGYKKAVTPATVNVKKEAKAEIPLERNEKYLLIEQAVASVDKDVGAENTTTEMNDFRSVVFLDHAVFVRARPKEGGQLEVTSWLYDLRTKRKVSQVSKTVPKNAVEAELATMPQTLYMNVRYEGELERPKEKEPPKQVVRTPIYKTWWFWTAAGVVVLGAVGTGVVIDQTSQPSCPEGRLCPSLTF